MTPDQPQPDAERRLWEQFASTETTAAGPCPAAIELAAWIDGRAAGAARDEIEGHLARCAECRQTVVELRLEQNTVAGSLAAAPDHVTAAARALVAPRPETRLRLVGWQAVGRWGMAAAASVAVCVAAYRAGWGLITAEGGDEVVLDEMSFGLLGELPDTGSFPALQGDLQ